MRAEEKERHERRFYYPPPDSLFTVRLDGRHNDRIVERLSRHQLIYSTLGLVIGLTCVIGGILLFAGGVIGKMSWTAQVLGSSSEIVDAAPGAVLFIVGLFVVYVTRYSVRSRW